MTIRQAVIPDVEQRAVQYVKGVGPARSALLAKLDVRSVLDLLLTAPRRYEDRSRFVSVRELVPGQPATVRVRVAAKTLRRLPGGRTIVQAALTDATGVIDALWFNQPYLARQLTLGEELVVYGRREEGRRPQLIHPEIERVEDGEEAHLHTGRIVPVYPLTQGLGQRWLRQLAFRVVTEYLDAVPDPLPGELRERLGLCGVRDAIRQLHFPDSLEAMAAARARLAFDELFALQIRLALRRRAFASRRKAHRYQLDGPATEGLRRRLPFRLTGGQERALEELRADLGAPAPMLRLLQGEVGCGKTALAAIAMAMAAQSGHQAVLMAPTELLAEQQHRVLADYLEPLGIATRLLAQTIPAAERVGLLREIGQGRIPIVIGTHALLEPDVRLPNLALVVIDEQHKFGVAQRAALVAKGACPDVLVMSATPIPRTLALSAYGDLQHSTITELPPGRAPVRTRILTETGRDAAYRMIEAELRQGRQGYVVYPAVDDGERRGLKSATRMAEELRRRFTDFAVGLIHGQMPAKQKDAAMQAFAQGGIALLASTVIVEVGLDVPNATVMLIEHAERFGLAQLHQLRGRIGRGSRPGLCLAMSDAADPEAQARLAAFAQTSDGFRLAERDLELRGPGELLGREQHGWLLFRVADLARDQALLEQARQEAFALVERNPQLTGAELAVLRRRIRLGATPGR